MVSDLPGGASITRALYGSGYSASKTGGGLATSRFFDDPLDAAIWVFENQEPGRSYEIGPDVARLLAQALRKSREE